MGVNVLWPFVPVAIILRYAAPNRHLWIFALSYLSMIPVANLLGFAGQERKEDAQSLWYSHGNSIWIHR
jgi:Ca2+:H+ antiporter